MLLIIRQKARLSKIAEETLTDIEKEILAGGADRHVDEEQTLLGDGCRQHDLWGGGLDFETKEIDYNSIINLRPGQDNPSRDILSKEVRKKFDTIVRTLLV